MKKLFSAGIFLIAVAQSFAANVAPLYFEGVSDSDQQKYWETLMTFKIWGTDKITLNAAELKDSVGAIGTTGDLNLSNARHFLGGPIFVGGNLGGSTAYDQLLNGPIRVRGNLSMSNNHSLINGVACVEGTASLDSSQSDRCNVAGTLLVGDQAEQGKCDATVVKKVPMNLTIPDLPSDYPSAEDKVINKGDFKIERNDVVIDIPDFDTTYADAGMVVDRMFDFYFTSMTFSGECKLTVRMRSPRILARFFVNGTIVLTSGSNIQVAYVDSGANYNKSTQSWENVSSLTRVDSDYSGNLLFYTTKKLELPSMNNTRIQGTFISKETISIGSNLNLAGQLLAKEIITGNELNGTGFDYVPFDAPVLNFDPKVWSSVYFQENDLLTKVPISLDILAKGGGVYFDYCFEFLTGSNAASSDDFIIDDSYKFPLCNGTTGTKDSGRVYIPENSKTPQDSASSIWIKARIDSLIENDEKFRLKIWNLVGATMQDGSRSSYIDLILKDAELIPETGNDTIRVIEDIPYTFAYDVVNNKSVKFKYESEGFVQQGIVIQGLPAKGTLLIGETPASVGSVITMDQLKQLKYKSAANEFSGSSVYASFTFKVVDEKTIVSTTIGRIDIYVTPVNDAPVITAGQKLTINEGSVSPAVVGTVAVTDADSTDTFTFAFDSSHENYTRVSELYEINSTTGTITVKKDAVLNYESADSSLTIAVIVTDNASTETGKSLRDTAEVIINIQDVNEAPIVAAQSFSVKENAAKGTVVDTVVATDPDNKATFKVLKYAIVDKDVPFAIDASTGVITVSGTLNYEAKKTYEITVKVSDATDDKLSDTAKVTISLNDVNEDPTLAGKTDTIPRVATGGDVVGKITGVDEDSVDVANGLHYELVGGDTSYFAIDGKTGEITVKGETPFLNKTKGEYSITVKVTDNDWEKPSSGTRKGATAEVKIVIKNNPPEIKTDVIEIPEDGSKTDTIVATDADKDSLKYIIDDPSSKFKIDSVTGEVYVKPGVKIDHESKDSSITVTIKVTDGRDTTAKKVEIKVTDVNEPPTIGGVVKVTGANEPPAVVGDTLHVSEDKPISTIVGNVVANDPENDTLTYAILVGDTSTFKIDPSTGAITLKKTLDYETKKTYELSVVVKDKQYADTAKFVIVVDDVIEKSNLVVTNVVSEDRPLPVKNDTARTNRDTVGVKIKVTDPSGKPYYKDTTLVGLPEGCSTHIFTDNNASVNVNGSDTVTICISTKTPEVVVKPEIADLGGVTGVTIVEPGKDTTAAYVNKKDNDLQVIVKDPVTGSVDTIQVEVKLDSVAIPAKTFESVTKIQDEFRLDIPDSVPYVYENDKVVKTYTQTVAGQKVTVSFVADKNGEPQVDKNGNQYVIVTYKTNVNGKDVSVSYAADALTGKPIAAGSVSDLVTETPIIPASDSDSKAAFTVTYTYTDKNNNSVKVSYVTDEKGELVKDETGDFAYNVSFTYENEYGNSATGSTKIIVDMIPPKVEITFPKKSKDGKMIEIIAVSTPVEWTVNGVNQDTLLLERLEVGKHKIIRIYRDKAGNEASDTVEVFVKKIKDVDADLVEAVVTVDKKREEAIKQYYEDNKNAENSHFAVSVFNPKDSTYNEVINENGKSEYSSTNKKFIGPTLEIKLVLPSASPTGGLATADDLIQTVNGKSGILVDKNGKLIAGTSTGSDGAYTISMDEYVGIGSDDGHCNEEYKNAYKKNGNSPNGISLYNVKYKMHIWVFTSLGNFVNDFEFKLDLNNEVYVDEAGLMKMYFTLTPDKDGALKDSDGRNLASGAYLMKYEITSNSTLNCNLPGYETKPAFKKNAKSKNIEYELKNFGYRHPKTK